MNRSLITRLAALGLAAALTACNLFEEEKKGFVWISGTESSWIGKPLDSLGAAGALEFRQAGELDLHKGRLIVANAADTLPGVAVVDTGTGLITEYYPLTLPPAAMAFSDDGRLIVAGTDYVSGSISVIDVRGKRVRQDAIPFGSDPGMTRDNGNVYLFDRTTGAVTGFYGSTPGKEIKLDVQTGANSNPYDLAIHNGKAYIARYNSTSLLILNSANTLDGGTRDSIDLSAYVGRMPLDSAPALVPRMASILAYNGFLFVTLQRLANNYVARDTSLVVVIDAANKGVVKVIPLRFRNPVSAVRLQGQLYIAGLAGYGDLLGGVEKIDLATQEHAGTVITEAALGGDVFGFMPTGTNAGYATYSNDFGFHTKVKKIIP